MPNQSIGNTSGFQLDPLIDQVEDVLAIRAAAITLMKEGKTIMEWSGNGTEAKKEWVAPISEILAETRRFLKLADPQTYGRIVRQSTMLRCG